MISVSGKNWVEKKVNNNSIEKIKQDLGFSSILSKLIISRSFDTTEINNINNHLELVNEFKNNVDFTKASDLLIDTIKYKENICVLGDYDVDGSSATSLLIRFLNHIKHPNFYYIPDRVDDGYGATKKLFKKLILKKPKLVIMVDCGSTSNDAVDFLNQNNIKSLIIDHHEINKPYPKSNVIINPKKNDGYIEYDYLCATALTYFFIDILVKKLRSTFNISQYLIYALLATICDVMPLRKINKIIAKNVIKKFDLKQNIAFNTLFELSNKKNKLTIDDLGYFIGPIINSGGRLGKSSYGTELLSSDNHNVVKERSYQLIKLNNKRREIEKLILDDINFHDLQKNNRNIIIYYNQNINEGLIGIIASRLKEYFNKPSIVITNSNNLLKGSARSTPKYNIGHVIKELLDNKIIENGGGHNMAAGFTLKKENINILRNYIYKDYSIKNNSLENHNNYDLEISTSAINQNFLDEINKLGPFGNDNPLPTFLLKKLKIIKTTIIKNNHISVILKPKNGSSLKSICFNCFNNDVGKHLLSWKKDIDLVCRINENIWNNKKSIQLYIEDIII